MSRTDVHRPPWVQENDPLLWHRMIVTHDHFQLDCWDPEQRRHLVVREAPCDLGQRSSWRCNRWPRGWNPYCGCRCCTGQDGRKLACRHDRTVLRNRLVDARKTAAADRDTIDIPAPGPVTKW